METNKSYFFLITRCSLSHVHNFFLDYENLLSYSQLFKQDDQQETVIILKKFIDLTSSVKIEMV